MSDTEMVFYALGLEALSGLSSCVALNYIMLPLEFLGIVIADRFRANSRGFLGIEFL